MNAVRKIGALIVSATLVGVAVFGIYSEPSDRTKWIMAPIMIAAATLVYFVTLKPIKGPPSTKERPPEK